MKTASLRVSAGEPDEQPSPMTRGSVSRAPRGSRGDAGHEQAGGEGEDRERHRRVGERRMEQERQVDRRDQPGPDGERPRATDRQAAFRGDVGGEPPGQDRHDAPRRGPTTTGPPRTSCRGAPSGSRRGRSGAAARPRTPGAGTRAAACRSSTARRRRDRGPRAGCAPRRRSRRCPPASGRRSGRRPRRGPAKATTKIPSADRTASRRVMALASTG